MGDCHVEVFPGHGGLKKLRPSRMYRTGEAAFLVTTNKIERDSGTWTSGSWVWRGPPALFGSITAMHACLPNWRKDVNGSAVTLR